MGKIIAFENLRSEIESIKSKGKSVVLTGGCFDILHEGHKKFLENAKKTGDYLLVLLESDESVTRRKGKNRPINTQVTRAENLQDIPDVDGIVTLPLLTSDQEYYEMTNAIEPDIIAVTKNDPLIHKKREQAEQVGGRVIEVIDRLPNLSTTDILNRQ